MQSLHIPKGKMRERVIVPSSKSYANRALILASLIKRPFTLKNLSSASDVTHLSNALASAGLKIQKHDDGITILNSFPECEKEYPSVIGVGEGGTTARFLASLLLLGKSRYTLVLGKRLKERPWEEFIQLARKYGAIAELHDDKLILQGPIQLPQEIEVDCTNTTQFATAFELIRSVTGAAVVPVNMDSSQSYWAMTVEMARTLPSRDEFIVPVDWSSASYPMSFAALNHEITFPRLLYDKHQADAKFHHILTSLGALEENQNGTVVTPIKVHKSLTLDVSDCLDLVPTLAYFLSHVEGTHNLKGIQNLIHKESNRLEEVIKLIKTFGRRASTNGQELIIEGNKTLIDNEINLKMPDDHRMVMAGTLFLLHHSGGTVSPEEAVSKSYPDFFKLISS